MNELEKVMNIDLRRGEQIEVGSVKDKDLLNILCFATHEGVNMNGTEFSREILMSCYQSFVDKPVVIVSNFAGDPTGHGFNFLTRQFNEKDRRYIGHVKRAVPCVVKDDGCFVEFVEGQDVSEFASAEGEMRVMCELVVYKRYMNDVADTLVRLHNEGNLKFSMEGLMDCAVGDDGIKHCTDIQFTGLAIVKSPAFENSYSLEVAEDEEDKGGKMDYEKAYNELKAKYDALVEKYNALEGGGKKEDKGSPGGSGGSGGGKKECAEVDAEKYAELLETLATMQTELAELKPYKEAAVAAEKKAIGAKRYAKLEKVGYTEKSVDELAELSAVAYAELLEASIDTGKPADTEIGEDHSIGVIHHNSKMKNDFDLLNGILADLVK